VLRIAYRVRLVLLFVGFILALLVGDAFLIEPYRIQVEEITVHLAHLPPDLQGLRIVQLSDLHLKTVGRRERQALAFIHQLKPDLIAITGDLVQAVSDFPVREARVAAMAEFLAALPDPPYGIWVSRGNTDIARYAAHNNIWVDAVQEGPAHLLVNRHEIIRVGNAWLAVMGADFAAFDRDFVADFHVADLEGRRVLAVGPSKGNSYSHYAALESLLWQDYEYSGRLRLDDPQGGIGVTFYSAFPAGYDRFYRLRRYNQARTFHLAPHDTSISNGSTDSGVDPEPGRWYQFRIQVRNSETRTSIRARVWPADEPEPEAWPVDAWDENPTRLRSGTIGVWSLDQGQKAFADLEIRPLSSLTPYWQADWANLKPGEDPPTWLDFGINSGNVREAARGLPAEVTTILLAHSPDQIWEAQEAGTELMLAGHTHGGQVRLPLIGPLYINTDLGRTYEAGLFQFGSTWLYINRGLGTRDLAVRFLCPPEITLITLQGETQSSPSLLPDTR